MEAREMEETVVADASVVAKWYLKGEWERRRYP